MITALEAVAAAAVMVTTAVAAAAAAAAAAVVTPILTPLAPAPAVEAPPLGPWTRRAWGPQPAAAP
jgi:hypothetical protein